MWCKLTKQGDESVKDASQKRLKEQDLGLYWSTHEQLPAVVAASSTSPEAGTVDGKTSRNNVQPSYWPYDGQTSYRQSKETTAQFIERLRPSKANAKVMSWIWVANPFVNATIEPEPDIEALTISGQDILDAFLNLKKSVVLQMDGKPKASITKKLSPHLEKLKDNLCAIAVNSHCLSGKWMLFVPVAKVDEVWYAIAEAVSTGKLGPLAKVATSGSDYDPALRLICIYTRDFSDIKDVKRVLYELVKLKMVPTESQPQARGVFYKADAYTIWGLVSGNEYGIPASMYGSKDLLGKKGVAVEGKQSV